MPASASLSSTWSSSGLPATETSGFGILSVNGRMRRPRPAARTMARVGLTGMLVSLSGPVGSGANPEPAVQAILARDDGGTTPRIFDEVKRQRIVDGSIRLRHAYAGRP